MLGLKLATDPKWANIAEENLEEILTDHAWCEQKAAINAISLITINSEKTALVTELLKVAIEELQHFQLVHDIIKARGYEFGRERRDDYVGELVKFSKKGGSRQFQLVEKLLFAAMIEARSCERFRVLSEGVQDEELKLFYKELMISEANHYTLFLKFAKQYGEGIDVEGRWKEWLEAEAKIIVNYGNKERVHG
jgi:tRNA-(ms[2]io[6]A)-hydroxylase